MNTLKFFLGFVELAAAFKFFSNADVVRGWGVLSRELFLALWAVIFLAAALYLFGIFRKADKPGLTRLTSGGLILVFSFYCLWGMSGKDLDFAMTAIAPPYSGGRFFPEWYARDYEWQIVVDDYDAAIEIARAEDKLLLVNFTGHT